RLLDAANNHLYLLQTYPRDTGEFMSQIHLPFYFDRRHWGN
ncbi:methyl-accepting chemotaxis protein, partial [Pseudomonas syringae pv. tagetis]